MRWVTPWILSEAGLKNEGPLRYLRGRSTRKISRSLVLHLALAGAYISALISGTVILKLAHGSPSRIIYTALFAPTVLVQMLLSAAAFGLTIHTVYHLRRQQTWDPLRATAGGGAAAMRAAWANAVYYRLGGLLGVLVYAPRIVLLGCLLWDLTAFRGEYLRLIADSHRPAVPPPFEILLLGAGIAAAFLLPLSTIGLEAASGLVCSTFAGSRQSASLIQILFTIGRFIGGAAALSASVGHGLQPASTGLILLLNGAAGDWGLGALDAAAVHTTWSAIPYAAFIGTALVGVVLIQSGLTALLLGWAAHRAQWID